MKGHGAPKRRNYVQNPLTYDELMTKPVKVKAFLTSMATDLNVLTQQYSEDHEKVLNWRTANAYPKVIDADTYDEVCNRNPTVLDFVQHIPVEKRNSLDLNA